MVLHNDSFWLKVILCLPRWTGVYAERCRVGNNMQDFCKIGIRWKL